MSEEEREITSEMLNDLMKSYPIPVTLAMHDAGFTAWHRDAKGNELKVTADENGIRCAETKLSTQTSGNCG